MKRRENLIIPNLDSRASDPQPLLGRTVVITRARAQSREMTELIEKLGGRVVHCPAIEVKPPDSWAALDAAIEKVESYDWVVFTSANGPEFFFRRAAELGKKIDPSIGGITVCAIGPATAGAVEKAGVRVDLVAKDSKAEGALKAITERVGGKAGIKGLRFLIPRARVARQVLPLELTRLGASVDAVEAYQTVKPDLDREAVIGLFSESKVDAIAFTSSSTVSNFASLVAPVELSSLLKSVLVGCIGPITTQTALEQGLENVVQPETYTATALVEKIAASLKLTNQG